ncbi:MAG: alpha/beta fold hydrolase [Paludibacteraceae bacterium]|nr:alpha/beta fold hydrolase [Paludibacteraceae bacterium]
MRTKVLGITLLLLQFLPLQACSRNEQKIDLAGPQGKIACTITLPQHFDPSTDSVPMVILMHGIFASKDWVPIPSFAKGLAKAGIASIRMDFNGHGKSGGHMQDMTIEKELADARVVWDYVQTLPYVTQVGLLGHSQGGVIASMTAGRLAAEQEGSAPAGIVLVAPGSVIKEACQGGKFFNARFDPQDPPEYIRCWGIMKLGREYLLTTQQLDIFGTAAAYAGPVLLLHGDQDKIVPLWCSERYAETYGERATLRIIPGVNHTITSHRSEVVAYAVDFFRRLFGKNN